MIAGRIGRAGLLLLLGGWRRGKSVAAFGWRDKKVGDGGGSLLLLLDDGGRMSVFVVVVVVVFWGD